MTKLLIGILVFVLVPFAGAARGEDAPGLVRAAVADYERGKYGDAKKRLLAARRALDGIESPLRIQVEQLLGATCIQLEEFPVASEHFGAAVALLEDSAGAAHVSLTRPLTFLAYARIASGQRLEGAASLAAAHALSRSGSAADKANVWHVGSVLAASEGRCLLAYRFAERAVALARKADEKRLLADVCFLAGKRALILGDVAASLDYLREAEKIYGELRRPSDRELAFDAALLLLRARVRTGDKTVEPDVSSRKRALKPGSRDAAALSVVAADHLIRQGRGANATQLLTGLDPSAWGETRSGRELKAYYGTVMARAYPEATIRYLEQSRKTYEDLTGYEGEVCALEEQLARLYASKGDAPAALRHARNAARRLRRSRGILDPSTRRALAKLETRAATAGAVDVAREAQQLLQCNRPPPRTIVRNARRLAKAGKHAAAAKLIDSLGAMAFGSRSLMRDRAASAYRLGDHAGMVRGAERAIEVDPLYKDAYFLRAAGTRRHDEAIVDATYALLLDPEMYSARMLRGTLLTSLGMPACALRDGDAVVSQKPSAAAHFNRALAHLAMGTWDKAVADLEEAFGLEWDASQALSLIGDAQRGKGDSEAALRSYDIALQDKPGSTWANYRKGVLLFDRGDAKGARALLQASIRSDNRLQLAHLYLWLCHDGEKSGRDAALRKAMAKGDRTSYTYHTAETLLDPKREEQLLSGLSKNKRDSLKSAQALLFVGCARIKRGEVDAGKKCLRRVLDIGPRGGLSYLSAKAALARVAK